MDYIDITTLAAALDAWERQPNPLDDAPYEAFRATHRKEARYLWLLSRSLRPPADVEPTPLRRLLAWGLISSDAIVTPLGRRLLATAKQRLAPDPLSMHDDRRIEKW